MKEGIMCPICNKLVGKIDEEGEMKKVYLWCRRCKKEIYIEDVKKYTAKIEELKN